MPGRPMGALRRAQTMLDQGVRRTIVVRWEYPDESLVPEWIEEGRRRAASR
ncbi:MAG: hypothetical protein ACLP3Q_09440 [Streptosporangiaceae bacterium]